MRAAASISSRKRSGISGGAEFCCAAHRSPRNIRREASARDEKRIVRTSNAWPAFLTGTSAGLLADCIMLRVRCDAPKIFREKEGAFLSRESNPIGASLRCELRSAQEVVVPRRVQLDIPHPPRM